MAIALVQTAALGSTSSGSSQQTSAFGSNPTVGNYLVAWAWGWTSSPTPATTFSDTGANTWTVPTGAKQAITVDLWCVAGYAKVATTAASFKVTMATSAPTSIMVLAAELSGVAAVTPLDGSAVGATGTTGGPATGSLAFTAGDLLVAVMTRDDSAYIGSTPTGFTRAGVQNNGSTFQVGEAIYALAPTSPVNPTWGSSTNKWAAAQLALLAASGGAPTFLAAPPLIIRQAVKRASLF